MLYLLKVGYCLLLIISLGAPLLGQNDQRRSPSNRKAPDSNAKVEGGNMRDQLTPHQQIALSTLEQLLEPTKDFKDVKLRIKVQARIADALWEYDQAQARHVFKNAFDAIESLEACDDCEHPLGIDPRKMELRDEVFQITSRRDHSLAEKFIKTIEDNTAENKPESAALGAEKKQTMHPELAPLGPQSEQATQQLLLATSMAETDPQRASQMTINSLNGGINFVVPRALLAIRHKDPALADKVFREVLLVAERDSTRRIVNVRLLAPYFIANHQHEAGSDPDPQSPIRFNPVLIQQFLNFAYLAFMSSAGSKDVNVPASFEYQTVQEVLPLFDSFMPERAGMIRAQLNQPAADAPGARRTSTNDAGDLDSIEELLDKASMAGSTLRQDRLYYQAAVLASRRGATAQALSIAEKLSNEQDRLTAKSLILYRAAEQALSKKDVEAAYRVTLDLPDLQLRAIVLSRVVSTLAKEKDVFRANEVLTETVQQLSKVKDTPEKALAMLTMTEVATLINPSTLGFETMSVTVTAINRANFDPQQPSAKTIDAKQYGGVTPTKMAINLGMFDFEKSFPSLARTDFDQALLLAKSIEKKEASVSAQLAVCSGVLTEVRKPQLENAGKEAKPQEQKKPARKKLSVKQQEIIQDK